PTYEAVCSGQTGHAEVIRVEYDPSIISYRNLLTIFFTSHDSTTLNRQGNDVGTQYRSIILTTTDEQKEEATRFIKELEETSKEGGRITTEVKPLEHFYEAEGYHKDYYEKNSSQPYCQIVINPKLEKAKKELKELLKTHGEE
ncbi:MAG: peptide-methionine (S)-S-oxide reductase MsrA, partial [Patescibacteria group bacterium]